MSQAKSIISVFEGVPFKTEQFNSETVLELLGLKTQTVFVQNGSEYIDKKDKFIFSSYGNDKLASWRHVGVIRTSDGSILEILPKVFRNSDALANVRTKNEARALLCKMLERSGLISYRTAESAPLAEQGHSLLEIFIHAFLREVQKLSFHGLRNDYVSKEENRFNKKGRINFTKQVKKNVAANHRLYCVYDEYCSDCIENQLLRSALWKTTRIACALENRRLAKQLLTFFEGISTVHHVEDFHFKKCRSDRQMNRYNPALTLARFILLTPSSPQIGDKNTIAILFDMSKIFEKTVEKTLEQLESISDFNSQETISWFAKLGAPKPDFLFKTDQQIVADAKWKLIKNGIPKKEDQYQLFSYMQATQSQLGIIFFPTLSNNISPRTYKSEIRLCSAEIKLIPFNLNDFSINF